MENFESLSHVRWECKYHVIFIPKYRRKVIYGKLRSAIGRILRDLCQQKGIEVLEGHAMPDHIHLCLKIPPKYSVSYVVGFLKGKSAVRIHRELLKERRMTGLHFWAAGYWVSTVGRDEAAVRRYIREQEHFDKGQGQLFARKGSFARSLKTVRPPGQVRSRRELLEFLTHNRIPEVGNHNQRPLRPECRTRCVNSLESRTYDLQILQIFRHLARILSPIPSPDRPLALWSRPLSVALLKQITSVGRLLRPGCLDVAPSTPRSAAAHLPSHTAAEFLSSVFRRTAHRLTDDLMGLCVEPVCDACLGGYV